MAVGFKSGGRKKGTLNKATIVVRNAGKIANTDKKSLGNMRIIAEWHMRKAKEAEEQKDAQGNPKPDLAWASECYGKALNAWKSIAEYEFSKLQSITVAGDPDRPQVTRIEVELVESRFEKAKQIDARPLDASAK